MAEIHKRLLAAKEAEKVRLAGRQPWVASLDDWRAKLKTSISDEEFKDLRTRVAIELTMTAQKARSRR